MYGLRSSSSWCLIGDQSLYSMMGIVRPFIYINVANLVLYSIVVVVCEFGGYNWCYCEHR